MSDNRRVLSAKERVLLEQRGCSAVAWDDVTVSHDFRTEQLRNVRFEGRTSIGSRTRISDSTIANYAIGDDCHIDDVLRMECRHSSTFGEGVGVAAVNENGGRTATIYRDITSQIAYIMTMMRNRKGAVEQLLKMATERAEQHRSDMGVVEDGSTVMGARFIREVHIESGATIEGASHL